LRLEVHPIEALSERTLEAVGALPIVSRRETRYDGVATPRIDGGAGAVRSAVVAALGSHFSGCL